jgi:CRP/FNR family cyclic AMP-dependent transcriptional regulator
MNDDAGRAQQRNRPWLGTEFSGFHAAQLELLRSSGRVDRWPPGNVLIREGEQPDRAILLEKGLVKVTAEARHGYTSLLAVRGPGELVGELSCLDGGVRSATVTAIRPVEGVVIAADRFARLLQADGELALAVSRSIVRRLRDSNGWRAGHGGLPCGGAWTRRCGHMPWSRPPPPGSCPTTTSRAT